MTEIILTILFGTLLIGGIFWLIKQVEGVEVEEIKQIEKDIAHLPEDVREDIWATYYRHQADSDLH